MFTKKLYNASMLFMDDESQAYFQEFASAYFLGSNRQFNDAYTYYESSRILGLEEYSKDIEFVICGAGNYGRLTLNALKHAGYKVKCILDNDRTKHGNFLDGVVIVSFFDFCMNTALNNNTVVIIDNTRLKDMFFSELIELGYPRKQIYINSDDIVRSKFGNVYFDLNELSHDDDEVFIDAGCYDGETSKEFINWSNGKYKKIYACEPMKDGYERCKNQLCNEVNVEVLNVALSNYNGEAKFVQSFAGLMGSRLGEKAENANIEIVHVNTIDNILNGDKATFIKMDIEGAELDALMGAEKTIAAYKPKLAISLYHKKEDLYEIPLYLHKIVPEYKFKLRHYSNKRWDLVLYCYI